MIIKTKHKDLVQPSQAHTKQQVYDSDTHSLDSAVWSPTNTVVENMSSAATLTTDEKSLDRKTSSFLPTSLSSTWLQKRQKNNKRNRAMLGCIGLVVFMVLLGTVVLWVGSAFILPKNKYSATLAQVPRSTSYSFNHPTSFVPTTTTSTSTTKTGKVTTQKPSPTTKRHHKEEDDDDDN
ncbi:hypothetical protein BC941DRAFT_474197 [Chlamydoabsidia padenii]|nr:hypothetical protein BC941DRAFT_474197 [Chlamydoabsidia padenii]